MLPKEPYFFQPLLPGFERKLSIPAAFLKYLDGQAFDKPAQLRGRGGKVWPVKINGRTFGDGWAEFVGDHDLHVGYFLVFKLEGDLMFDVMVLDHTACEKEYSPLAVEKTVVKIEPEDSEEEPAGGDSRRTSVIMNGIEIEVPPVKLEEDMMFHGMVLDHTATENECGSVSVEEPVLKIEQLNLEDKPTGRNSRRTKKLAKNMQPSSSTLRRPYFEATMTHYSIERSRLYIPKIFASHLSKRSCQMIVMNQQERSWPVMLICRKFNFQSYFGGGWKAFCRENDIKKGDTIILELVKKGAKPVLQLIGFQANPRAKNRHHDSQSGSSLIRHPHLWVTINEYNIKKRYLNIPRSFANRYGLTREYCKMVLKDETASLWLVSLRRNNEGRVFIGAGWTEFVKSKQLKVGDEFRLELIEGGKKPVMKFYGHSTGGTDGRKRNKNVAAN